MQTSALSLTSTTTEDQPKPNVSMIESTERKHELSLLANIVGDYQSPVFTGLPGPGTN